MNKTDTYSPQQLISKYHIALLNILQNIQNFKMIMKYFWMKESRYGWIGSVIIKTLFL